MVVFRELFSYEKHSEIAASSWQKIIKIGYNETQRSYQQIYLADADFLHAVEEKRIFKLKRVAEVKRLYEFVCVSSV